ncbi:MAG: homoserine kinase [Chloroflexi bacterium]|nr:homoserine kinase [Chloroflexota bacterium]
MKITIKVPATSANLGPGFDALGLALDLWNETEFTPADIFSLHIEGEGADKLAPNPKNLIARSMQKVYDAAGKQMPALEIRCLNRIPLGAGLGSSAAAIITGLLGANALLDSFSSNDEILNLAVEIEGHPDNVAPALMGGLVVSTINEGRVIARKIAVGARSSRPGGRTPPLHVTVVQPDFNFTTKQARAVLPKEISMKDAVHNLSRAVLVTEAFRTGDLDLLGKVMDDAMHQPYRLPLIPGAREAMEAAKKLGAAVALSGAGPSLIAFSANHDAGIGSAMKREFESAGLSARVFELGVSEEGAKIESGE